MLALWRSMGRRAWQTLILIPRHRHRQEEAIASYGFQHNMGVIVGIIAKQDGAPMGSWFPWRIVRRKLRARLIGGKREHLAVLDGDEYETRMKVE
jgi:hypothetical protein